MEIEIQAKFYGKAKEGLIPGGKLEDMALDYMNLEM